MEEITRKLFPVYTGRLLNAVMRSAKLFDNSSTVIAAVQIQFDSCYTSLTEDVVPQQLIVLFKSGHAYAYLLNDYEDMLERMLESESPGKFVHAELKHRQSRKLEDGELKLLIHALIMAKASSLEIAEASSFMLSNHPLIELYNSKYFKPSLWKKQEN